MNKFIQYVTSLDLAGVEELLGKEPKWITWSEPGGKNALHYLCGLPVSKSDHKAEISLLVLKLLLKRGVDINSIHQIPEDGGFFPATPLWYAYTRGRNERLFKYLLKKGADPGHCMFAIVWYDDVASAKLFKKFGAGIEERANGTTPFLGAFCWKRFQVAEWLLKNGADVNAADKEGNIALFYAVKRKYDFERIKWLLRFGADVNHENNDGISPKKLAESNRQRKILSLFAGH